MCCKSCLSSILLAVVCCRRARSQPSKVFIFHHTDHFLSAGSGGWGLVTNSQSEALIKVTSLLRSSQEQKKLRPKRTYPAETLKPRQAVDASSSTSDRKPAVCGNDGSFHSLSLPVSAPVMSVGHMISNWRFLYRCIKEFTHLCFGQHRSSLTLLKALMCTSPSAFRATGGNTTTG